MNFLDTINSFKDTSVIKASTFKEHFKNYPNFAKLILFWLRRDSLRVEYIYKDVHYKSYEELIEKNPDNLEGMFYAFKYPNKNTDELFFRYED